jgi:hypothetical protein
VTTARTDHHWQRLERRRGEHNGRPLRLEALRA